MAPAPGPSPRPPQRRRHDHADGDQSDARDRRPPTSSVASSVTATFSEAVQASTVAVSLTSGGGVRPAAPSPTRHHTDRDLQPRPRRSPASTTYTATVTAPPTPPATSWTPSPGPSRPTPPDTTKPTVTARTPAAGAANVATAVHRRTATFSEAVTARLRAVRAPQPGRHPRRRDHGLQRRHAAPRPSTPAAAPRPIHDLHRHPQRRHATPPATPWTRSPGPSPPRRAPRACPCTIWPRTATPAGDRPGHQRGRGRREVPGDPERHRHRGPLLQAHRDHRHPRREPVDQHRHQAGHRHLHRRERQRLAAGELRDAGRVTAGTTYVASYFAPSPLRRQPRLLHHRHHPRPAHRAAPTAPTAATASTGTARRRRFPDQHATTARTTGSTSSSRRRQRTRPRPAWSTGPAAPNATGVPDATPWSRRATARRSHAGTRDDRAAQPRRQRGPRHHRPTTPSAPGSPSRRRTALQLLHDLHRGRQRRPRRRRATAHAAGVLVVPDRRAAAARRLDEGPGGPIAVVTSTGNPSSTYLAEILRAEGLNEFATVRVSTA